MADKDQYISALTDSFSQLHHRLTKLQLKQRY